MKIFVISLKKSKQRRQNIKSYFAKYNIGFEFFDAIDGNNLTSQHKNKLNKFKAWLRLGRKITNGEIGCALSHSKIYEKISNENINEAIVLEDDALLTKQFANFVKNKTYNKINKDFIFLFCKDFYYKSCMQISKDIKIYEPILNPNYTVGYYINNKMAQELYKHTKKIEYVADYPVLLNSIGSVAIVKPNIINHDEFESIIGNRHNNELNNWILRFRVLFLIEYIFNIKLYYNIMNYVKYKTFLRKIKKLKYYIDDEN